MENLRCPYCGGEMQKGWLRSRRATHFCPRRRRRQKAPAHTPRRSRIYSHR